MCTVTWFYQSGSLRLFHSRDEALTRLPALPPKIQVRRGVRFVAPLDADAGGTWVGVNEFGLVVGLLNRYLAETSSNPTHTPPSRPSRGLLVIDVLSCQSLEAAIGFVQGLKPNLYAPFTLALLQPNQRTCILDWDERELNIDWNTTARLPLVSSLDQAQASAARGALFAELQATAFVNEAERAQQFQAFHASHVHGPSSLSVCMHRDDAKTVSHTQVCVAANEVWLRYYASALCEPGEVFELSL